MGDFELALAKASIVRQTVIAGASMGAIGAALLDDASHGYPLDQAQLDARQFVATDARAVQRSFGAYVINRRPSSGWSRGRRAGAYSSPLTTP